jgi:hypothetical protein
VCALHRFDARTHPVFICPRYSVRCASWTRALPAHAAAFAAGLVLSAGERRRAETQAAELQRILGEVMRIASVCTSPVSSDDWNTSLSTNTVFLQLPEWLLMSSQECRHARPP